MKKLFTGYRLGDITLKNRFIMAPMTRSRARDEHADALTALYYAQRASAGLIISEGLPVSREGTGYLFNPGIYLDSHVEAWLPVTQAVHKKGGKIFAQLWHVGRVSHTSLQPEGQHPVSSVSVQGGSAFAWDENGEPATVTASPPRALLTEEIKQIVADFRNAAANAISAGFDGVEVHGANGYLIEQFINPVLNTRDDGYGGGSLANRTRLLLEIVDAISDEIGTSRTGVRLSPCNQLQDMAHYADTSETYLYIGKELSRRGIAYVHLMAQGPVMFNGLLRDFRQVWRGTLILAGGLTPAQAAALIDDGLTDLAAFGSPFIANPDFVERVRKGWPLTMARRSSYYGGGEEGYTDYPFHGEDHD
ncbi:NADH:flavin oxidoreductase/NADH oxidase [Erwinia billingiae Eb661]|uniref:NADH:flavin oxidoreductase/NADH oxidase n=1 Tax=Erwinia billingiae (strain Eb661) TaxID=634500 RepID=D8MU19_ERWBE|nr:alkene reductase [Erwinia billingiae]CAX60326.1 NADH:flavin oxidoreductase/NADH oxidase [Erwinia billingiae Eb661]